MQTHPKGSSARILLTSVFGPYAQDDEFGSRAINPMELYHNQVTRAQGSFSLRMFHPRYKLSEGLASVRGHDFMVLHHEVYLLGAFDSASRGARLYLLQDSGSGRTLMATARELDALTQEVQLLSVSGPVAVPQGR